MLVCYRCPNGRVGDGASEHARRGLWRCPDDELTVMTAATREM
jgi:hypothetical protein